jgi:large subunit ribosomal protein L21
MGRLSQPEPPFSRGRANPLLFRSLTVHAIIEDRGRQFVVHDGDKIRVDHMADAKVGSDVVFDKILCLGENMGTPVVEGATVTARVEEHAKAKKILVQKFKRRKDYRRKQGHRQTYTWLTVTAISS